MNKVTYIITLDIGTSGMLASLYNSVGECFCTSEQEYSTEFIYPSKVEQDPATWAHAAYAVLKKIGEYAQSHQIKIEAIAITSQRASLIAVDETGAVLRKALMWQDKRAIEQCNKLEKTYTTKGLYAKTGLRLSPYAVLPRILWMWEQERSLFDRAKKFIGVQDYVFYVLSGEMKTDWTQAARTMLMDIQTFDWDEDLLKAAHVTREKLCELVAPGTVAGYLQTNVAQHTNLLQGTPILLCGGDQQNAAVGLNVVREGLAEANTGTGSFVIAHTDRPVFDEEARILCSASAIAGKWVAEASVFNSGSIYRWFGKQFYHNIEASSDSIYEKMTQEAAKAPAGANGVLMLPHFEGSGAPYWEPEAKGLFFNLSLGSTRGDMARAVLEGIALEIADNLMLLEQKTGVLEQISIAGGMTKSDLFAQIQADAFGVPVSRYENEEATSRGALIIAAVGLGIYDTIEESLKNILKTDTRRFWPDKNNQRIYKILLERKQKLFYALKKERIYPLFMESLMLQFK